MDQDLRLLRHDLRGRANTLVLYATILPMTNDRHEQLEYIDQIGEAADGVLNILDRLDATPAHFAPENSRPPANSPG